MSTRIIRGTSWLLYAMGKGENNEKRQCYLVMSRRCSLRLQDANLMNTSSPTYQIPKCTPSDENMRRLFTCIMHLVEGYHQREGDYAQPTMTLLLSRLCHERWAMSVETWCCATT